MGPFSLAWNGLYYSVNWHGVLQNTASRQEIFSANCIMCSAQEYILQHPTHYGKLYVSIKCNTLEVDIYQLIVYA